MIPFLLGATILAGLGIGVAATVAIAVFKVVKFIFKHIIDWAKEKIRNKNDKVMVADTTDILKEKMKNSKTLSISEEEKKFAEENPIIMAHYNEETDEVDEINYVEAEKIDDRVWTALDESNGMIVYGA